MSDETSANLAAVERAVEGVRWYRDDSPLEYIKAKGGKITMFKVEPITDADIAGYCCRMAVSLPTGPTAIECYGNTEQRATQNALITLAFRHGWRVD